MAKIDKDKVKKVAKTSAYIAGGIAVASLLGYAGLNTMTIAKLKWERDNVLGPNLGGWYEANGHKNFFLKDYDKLIKERRLKL